MAFLINTESNINPFFTLSQEGEISEGPWNQRLTNVSMIGQLRSVSDIHLERGLESDRLFRDRRGSI